MNPKSQKHNNIMNNDLINKIKSKKIILFGKSLKIDDIKNFAKIMDYNDDELNDLSYDLALQNDKRSYWQLYISLIKTKHEFIYQHSFIIKITIQK